MRNGVGIALAGAALATAAPLAAQQALIGATIIDGTGRATENGVVLVQGDRIACAGTAQECPVPSSATRIDLSGRFLTPGLVDAHVHFAQTGWLDGRPDGLEDPAVYPYEQTVAALRADPGRWHRSYLCSGVTSVFDTGGAPWTVSDSHATDTDRPDRVHVKASGPLITHGGRNQFFAYGSLADQPTFLPMESAAQIRVDVARVRAMGAAAVKVWYLAPPPGRKAELDALLMEVGAAARDAGLPLIVHATELVQAKTALRAGATMLVHSVEDDFVDDEFLALLKAKDVVYAPTLTVGRHWTQALFSVVSGGAARIDDPNRCVDADILARIENPAALKPAADKREGFTAASLTRRFERVGREAFIMARNLKTVSAAGGRIVLATDAGNPLTLHGPSVHAELEAMQAAGLSPQQVIIASTHAAARAIGIDRKTGSVEAGKTADLLVLAEDPRRDVKAFRALTHVMRAGVLKTQKELQVR